MHARRSSQISRFIYVDESCRVLENLMLYIPITITFSESVRFH